MFFFRTDHEWGMTLSTFERDPLLLHDVNINIIFMYLWFSDRGPLVYQFFCNCQVSPP